jgi:Rieske Fe-S protein
LPHDQPRDDQTARNSHDRAGAQPRQPPQGPTSDAAVGGKHGAERWISKNRARAGFRRTQLVIGATFLASAFAGVYLLATDGSLWQLAVSHAVGLVAVVIIDLLLAGLNLLSVKRVYLASLAAALLGLLLQLGDILTAPQYNMAVPYFASYLFGLWAFDLLLGLQVAIMVMGAAGRGYAQNLARRRARQGRELSYSRRGFVKALVGFAAVVGVAVGLGSVKLPPPTQPGGTASTSSGPPGGPIANTADLQANSPVYFDYPTGYPSVLMKKADGSLTALSLLCTHVCCQCTYYGPSNEIYCPCHGSLFSQDGKVLRGPASLPLPQIELRVDGQGNVFPVRVNGSSPCLG